MLGQCRRRGVTSGVGWGVSYSGADLKNPWGNSFILQVQTALRRCYVDVPFGVMTFNLLFYLHL